MMRWNGFGRSVAFAAVAGAGLPVAQALLAPALGVAGALRLTLVAVAVIYVAGLAPRARASGAAGLAGAAAGVVLLALPLGVHATAAGAAAWVALGRSGLLYRARPLRALATEALLLAGGLGLARFLAQGGVLGLALGLWGFLLVQSVFFLIGGVAPRGPRGPEDPFERSRAELLALLR
jgi:hypothetical protein